MKYGSPVVSKVARRSLRRCRSSLMEMILTAIRSSLYSGLLYKRTLYPSRELVKSSVLLSGRVPVVYLRPAAKCDGPIWRRQQGVNQPVMVSLFGMTGPDWSLVPCLWAHLAHSAH